MSNLPGGGRRRRTLRLGEPGSRLPPIAGHRSEEAGRSSNVGLGRRNRDETRPPHRQRSLRRPCLHRGGVVPFGDAGPLLKKRMTPTERGHVMVRYIPASRDVTALTHLTVRSLGRRLMKAIQWERKEEIGELIRQAAHKLDQEGALTRVSATILALSSSDRSRRRPVLVKTSNRRTGSSGLDLSVSSEIAMCRGPQRLQTSTLRPRPQRWRRDTDNRRRKH